jgi:hypothetical protein
VKTNKMMIAAGGMLAGLTLFLAGSALAQESGHGMAMGHEGMHRTSKNAPAMARIHGGEIDTAAHRHFETLFTADGIRLYVYDKDRKPVDTLKNAKATVTLKTKDGMTKTVALQLLSPDEKTGRTQSCFSAPYDFSKMKPGTMQATVEVQGLSKDPIEFEAPVTLMHQTLYTCTMDTDVVAEDPGSCPKCGMTLVPRHDDSDTGSGTTGSNR